MQDYCSIYIFGAFSHFSPNFYDLRSDFECARNLHSQYHHPRRGTCEFFQIKYITEPQVDFNTLKPAYSNWFATWIPWVFLPLDPTESHVFMHADSNGYSTPCFAPDFSSSSSANSVSQAQARIRYLNSHLYLQVPVGTLLRGIRA